MRAGVGQGAIQLRRALRSTLAVTSAFGVLLVMEPTTALIPTLLMTTFALVQASWNATMSRAKDRFVGIMMGGIVVVLALLLLPESFMFPLAITGLVVGMWFITDRPAIGAAGMIVMSVGINAEIRHLDPGAVMVEYIVLAACAILISTVIGFAVVPAWRPPELTVRVESARISTVGALRTLGAMPGSEFAAWGQQVINARAAIDQLVPDHDSLDDRQHAELDHTRTDLRATMLAAIFYTLHAPDDSTKELTLMADRIPHGDHDLQS